MNFAFLQYYRCPDNFCDFDLKPTKSRWDYRNDDQADLSQHLFYELSQASVDKTTCALSFDPTEIANYLRLERYVTSTDKSAWKEFVRNVYYAVRPALPVSVRRHLQKFSLKGWDQKPFPQWPVDRTVDEMFHRLMALSLRANRCTNIPFVWFWPEGKSSCAIVTHDVETSLGLNFIEKLMDIDDSFGIKSSFQVIPESRYTASLDLLSRIRNRGFEINVHDLTHDGHLFDEQSRFQKQAEHINEYLIKFGSKGFRSGVLYRNLDWYSAFKFSYDMSVPNIGHLDPQPGGCCTTMPYYIGNIVELPLTTVQDYSLFNILNTYSTNLWEQQIDIIKKGHGLMSFNIHPDYLDSIQAVNTYEALLGRLEDLRTAEDVWIPLPEEVDIWWRQRSQMQVRSSNGTWRIEGPGAERARLAFATLDGDSVHYSFTSENQLIGTRR